jgi:hypothetical protein
MARQIKERNMKIETTNRYPHQWCLSTIVGALVAAGLLTSCTQLSTLNHKGAFYHQGPFVGMRQQALKLPDDTWQYPTYADIGFQTKSGSESYISPGDFVVSVKGSAPLDEDTPYSAGIQMGAPIAYFGAQETWDFDSSSRTHEYYLTGSCFANVAYSIFTGDTDKKANTDIYYVPINIERQDPFCIVIGNRFTRYTNTSGSALYGGILLILGERHTEFEAGILFDNSNWFGCDEFEVQFQAGIAIRYHFGEPAGFHMSLW